MHGKEVIYMKKNGSFILRLVFGLMGAIYAVLGLVFLVIATKAAGSIARIFTLPEEELAFAINGVVFTVLGAAFLLVTGILILVEGGAAAIRHPRDGRGGGCAHQPQHPRQPEKPAGGPGEVPDAHGGDHAEKQESVECLPQYRRSGGGHLRPHE